MRTAFALGGLVCFLALTCAALAAGKADRDEGIIEIVSDNTVEIQGLRGVHVLELVDECAWCEGGIEVIVTFKGYGRALLRPGTRSALMRRPVKALVIKDGRD